MADEYARPAIQLVTGGTREAKGHSEFPLPPSRDSGGSRVNGMTTFAQVIVTTS